jgi:hypothetical protein
MTTIVDEIREANYLATEAQIEQLAASYVETAGVFGSITTSYFKALIAGCQKVLGKGRKKYPNFKGTQLQTLEAIAKPYYDAVVRGVTTDDMALVGADELELKRRRNEIHRRCVFARTAKSTIFTFMNTGGDIRTVDLHDISKDKMRKIINETRGVTTWDKQVETHRSRIEDICRKLAKNNPGEAREILESVLSHIQGVLDNLPVGGHEVQENVVVFAADTGSETVVEIPQDFGEQAAELGGVPETHIPALHEFQEVSAA